VVRRLIKSIHKHLQRSGKVSSEKQTGNSQKQAGLKVEHKPEQGEKQEVYRPGESTMSAPKKRRRRRKPASQRASSPQKAEPARERDPSSDKTKAAASWDPSSFIVDPEEGKTRFHDLDLPQEVMHAIHDLKFKYCTPIQAQVLPHTLKGRDASGKAQTGTGKTAAFLITMLSRFVQNRPDPKRRSGTPRALIIAPTRELVIQIAKETKDIGK